MNSPIQEMSPSKEQEDSIAQMCQQLTMGLSALTTEEDPFSTAPAVSPATFQHATQYQHQAQVNPQPGTRL